MRWCISRRGAQELAHGMEVLAHHRALTKHARSMLEAGDLRHASFL